MDRPERSAARPRPRPPLPGPRRSRASVQPGSTAAQAGGSVANAAAELARPHATRPASAAPGSSARMNASPTRKALHAGRAHAPTSAAREDAALGDDEAPGRHSRQQLERRLERDLEGAQVAVVDADQRRPQGAARARARAASCTSTSTAMPSACAIASKSRISASSRHGGDQQDRVGAHRARLEHLPGVDDEVLAQHRQRRTPRAPPRDTRRALEELRVGQHAQRRRAVPLVARGDLGRQEIRAQHALARARLLDLGDHRGAAGGDLARAARRRSRARAARLGTRAHRGEVAASRARPRPPRA